MHLQFSYSSYKEYEVEAILAAARAIFSILRLSIGNRIVWKAKRLSRAFRRVSSFMSLISPSQLG